MTKQLTKRDFITSNCPHLGRPCSAVNHMLRTLAQAMDMAQPVTADDFEITGDSQLQGCPNGCPARYIASHKRIRIFCGVDAAAQADTLDQYADHMLNPSHTPMPAYVAANAPRAFAEARPRSQMVDEAVRLA